MFIVLNKSKIYSYMVALSTVVILFVVAASLNNNIEKSENIIETSTNVVYTNRVQNTDMNSNINVNEKVNK